VKAGDVRNLTWASMGLLVTGLLLPCMTIHPALGELTGWVEIFAPSALASTQYSILGGVVAMFEGGSPGIAIILFLFSVLFPLWKLFTYLRFLRAARAGRAAAGRSLGLAIKLGKYSMLDVFVIAVLVVGVKGLPGGSRVELNAGIYFFAGSVLLSMIAGQFIKSAGAKAVAK